MVNGKQVSRPVSKKSDGRGVREKKRGGLVSSEAVDSRVYCESSVCSGVDVGERVVKGGGDRWLIMATAMTNALERMRDMYQLIERLRELHAREGCTCAQHSGNWIPLQNETAAAANILKSGLK